jgi:hypothetical protein
MTLPSIRYPAPSRAARATRWAEGWRKRWFRFVGSVHQHHATRELVAFYSDERPPERRIALQNELEARANGAGEVLAVCRRASRDFDRKILAAYNAKVQA